MSVIGKIKLKNLKDATKILTSSKLYYYTILSFVKMLALIPFGVLYAISDVLYYPFYYIIRYRRKIVRRNLTESFPDKSLAEIVRIEKAFYHFFIDMALESCKLVSISHDEIRRRVKFTNIEVANDVLSHGGSVSVFTGHHGNWEWMSSIGLWLCKEATAAQIYHKLRNKSMDTIMTGLRERMGNVCVEMYKTVRYVAQAAKDGKPHLVGFIADQSPKKREVKHFIPFLNHDVPVLTGSEKVTKHFGYAALYLSMRRVRRGYYECEFTVLHDDPQSLPDFELTSLYYKHLEEDIRQQPELYLWTHNRFKHARRPESQDVK